MEPIKDIDKVLAFHRLIERRVGREFDYTTFKPDKLTYPNAQPEDEILCVGERPYWSYYYFREDRLIHHWLSE